MTWEDEGIQRMIYSKLENNRVTVGSMAARQYPSGATGFQHDQLMTCQEEVLETSWEVAYGTASSYTEQDLEKKQAFPG